MQKIFVFLLALLLTPFEYAYGQENRCAKPLPGEKITYQEDFKRSYTLPEMADAFREHYESGKRLKGRAYYDEALKAYVLPHFTGLVKLDSTFLRSITRHVEIALERRYADFVFFPDMGHSHLHIPTEDYERLKKIEPISLMYEKMFSYRRLQILYHTAEKLQVKSENISHGLFPQDPVLLWRYFSRNPVGDNNGGENVKIFFQLEEPEKYNTVKDIPGHKEYSAGFDISASKDACFPYQHGGKTYYFDISLESLPCRDCGGDPN
jgi:hypothetical protein